MMPKSSRTLIPPHFRDSQPMNPKFFLLISLLSFATQHNARAEELVIASWYNPPETPTPGLLHTSYHSQSMDTKVGYSISLPPDYETSNKRYPVIYWLHGRYGNEQGRASILKNANDGIKSGLLPPFILVFASGGQHTVYADSYDGKYLAETTIIRELIPHIDQTYRTIPERGARAIQGMSMGGCGAMKFALKYPELFSSVVAYAGGYVSTETLETKVFQVYKDMFNCDQQRYESQLPFAYASQNADKLKNNLAIRIVCGSQDLDLPLSKKMSDTLHANNIDHDFLIYAHIPHKLDLLMQTTGPDTFHYACQHFTSFRTN